MMKRERVLQTEKADGQREENQRRKGHLEGSFPSQPYYPSSLCKGSASESNGEEEEKRSQKIKESEGRQRLQ